MKITRFLVVLLLFSLQLPAQINLELHLISDAFERVVDITNAGDDRLFIVEQAGRIRIIQSDGQVNTTPFLDITSRVRNSGEQGLLGLAFHPNYAENGYFFVNYINENENTVVARYQVSTGNPAQANPQSETILFTIVQPYTDHNGGDLNFGPDGYLYISSGDGGDAGDPLDNAQSTSTLLGKILRIDVDNQTTGASYTSPADNPFADGPGGNKDEIWAIGLRNPWRFSFDRLTGDMWIGDVGQGGYEEIDFESAASPGGLNYGWRCYEGDHTFNTTDCGSASQYTFPVYEYDHSNGSCSVTGGYVYRGADYPDLYGLYLYTDYCNSRIWALSRSGGNWNNEEILNDPVGNFSTLGEDYRGELYVGSLSGSIYQLVSDPCATVATDLIVDEDPIPAGTYRAANMLASGGTVAAGTSVTFKAGELILLEPGFQARSGSDFRTLIEACAPASNLARVSPQLPEHTGLYPTLGLKLFPNPARSGTTIRYTLPEAAEVDVQIWDLLGKAVARPVDAQQQEAGVYQLSFPGSGLAEGLYLVVIRAGPVQQIARMEIIR